MNFNVEESDKKLKHYDTIYEYDMANKKSK